MENSRRNFLKIASASALGLGLGAGDRLTASDTSAAEDEVSAAPDTGTPVSAEETIPEKHETAVELNQELPKTAKQWGMVIDTRKFHGPQDLEPIVNACRKAHNIPSISNKNHEIKWIWAEKFHHVFPTQINKYLSERVEHRPIPALCNHCENPPCVKACPTRATFKRDDGIVMMDYHRCIGCRFCMVGCPYGARSFNWVDPRPAIEEKNFNPKFPTRMKGVVEKCNFCAERIARGEYPACVEASKGAIYFGDLDDPNSQVRKILKEQFTIRRKPDLGTEPAVYYII
jgi:molybdopterin-containing oxidoreductase family iron-sulfur binding subunit